MANIRIKDQTTDTALAAGDYVIVDNATEGTRKFDIGQKLVDIDDDITDVKSDLNDTANGLANTQNTLANTQVELATVQENLSHESERIDEIETSVYVGTDGMFYTRV